MCLDREKFAGMIDEFYRIHGWDKEGNIRPETLERLGITAEYDAGTMKKFGLEFEPVRSLVIASGEN